jgi:cytochrome b
MTLLAITLRRSISAGSHCMNVALRKVKVWDAWVRLFHWSIVLLIIAQYVTAELGQMEWHFRCGYLVLVLLVFRLGWGLMGSESARFARFVKSPIAALAHLKHLRRREPDTEVGHNAAGGWMVLLLLALLLAQVGTGLFANEEPGESYAAHGPFALRITDSLSAQLTGLHEVGFNLLLGAVGLHVAVVLAYAVLKRQDLLRPMVTGFKRLPASIVAPRLGHPLIAVALLGLGFALVWWLSQQAG